MPNPARRVSLSLIVIVSNALSEVNYRVRQARVLQVVADFVSSTLN